LLGCSRTTRTAVADRRFADLFAAGAPAVADRAATAAALHAAGPGLTGALSARRRGLLGVAVITGMLMGGVALATQQPGDPIVEIVADEETFTSPGGSVTTRLADDELALVAHMAAPGYEAEVLAELMVTLAVLFRGPEEHVISLTISDDMIIEDEPDTSAPTPTDNENDGDDDDNPADPDPPGQSIALG
jgi:hypothetical protein